MRHGMMWLCFAFGSLHLTALAGVPHVGSAAAEPRGEFVPPRLTVKGWYLEKDGAPVFLAGYSPKAGFRGALSHGRIEAVRGRANYMRTWLELWDRPEFPCPFQRVEGKADLSRYDAGFFRRLREMLDASARAGVVQELTLFNPWGAGFDWDHHWWNPRNNIQGLDVTKESLYTLGNPCQSLQERWVEKVLETVDASLARHFVIIEIDNELGTGGGAWRRHFVEFVKRRGDYIVSTIADYCGDYDAVKEANDIVARHRGASADPQRYWKKVLAYDRCKPVIFNELYVWRDHPREAQRTVFWTIFMSGGMFCVDHWGGGRTSEADTLNDVAALAQFANGIPFHRFKPDNTWIVSCPGHAWALSRDDGAEYLAYLWGRGEEPFRVSLPRGAYGVSWFGPGGERPPAPAVRTVIGGPAALTPPPHEHDIVCYIRRSGPSR